MATKIRLQRQGRKGSAFFHIVIADSRSKRDGRNIERIGTYNPVTDPATIELDIDRAVHWLQVGAQPTNTARNILSYKGALMKKHLLDGVTKGAFDEAEAEKRFDAWLEERANAVEAKKDGLVKAKEDAKKAALEAERKKVEDKLAAEKEAADAEAAAQAEAEAAEAAEAEATEEVTEEAAPEAETTEETPEADASEEPATEE